MRMVTILVLALVGASARAGGTEQRTLRFAKKHLFVGPHENAAVADIDRDGHLDVVWGPYWFAGPDFVPRAYRPNHVSGDYFRNNSDHVYDVGGDG